MGIILDFIFSFPRNNLSLYLLDVQDVGEKRNALNVFSGPKKWRITKKQNPMSSD